MCNASPDASSTPPENTDICNRYGNSSFLFWSHLVKMYTIGQQRLSSSIRICVTSPFPTPVKFLAVPLRFPLCPTPVFICSALGLEPDIARPPHTNKHTKQTNKRTNKWTNKQTNKQIHTHTRTIQLSIQGSNASPKAPTLVNKIPFHNFQQQGPKAKPLPQNLRICFFRLSALSQILPDPPHKQTHKPNKQTHTHTHPQII